MAPLPAGWTNNRSQSYMKKIRRWLKNPIGAAVRITETLYFGNPLFLIIKGYGDLSEISHLSKIIPSGAVPTNFYEFTEARVSLPNRLILLDTGHISAPDHSSHTFLSGNYWNEIRKLQRKVTVGVYEKCIPMPTPEYFYHFLIDDLASLLRVLEENPEYKPMFFGPIPKYVEEVLELLGISYEISSQSVITIRDLKVPKKKLQYMLEFQASIQSRIKKELLLDTKSPSKIYIGRRNLARNDEILEDKLRALLVPNGFVEVFPDELSFLEQARLFANAEAVIALHGGALSNIVFCSRSTKIIEIFNHEYRTYPFGRISEELGFEYVALESSNLEEMTNQLSRVL